ncbi:hypothetical protein T08_9737 [Trichinella sp. T8]|nr:hypothetical protein T08_9737 [Trichinella sp. T8]
MNYRYKCYYDHEHCLEDISLAMNLLRSQFLPLKSYKRAIFLAISRQIRICETNGIESRKVTFHVAIHPIQQYSSFSNVFPFVYMINLLHECHRNGPIVHFDKDYWSRKVFKSRIQHHNCDHIVCI